MVTPQVLNKILFTRMRYWSSLCLSTLPATERQSKMHVVPTEWNRFSLNEIIVGRHTLAARWLSLLFAPLPGTEGEARSIRATLLHLKGPWAICTCHTVNKLEPTAETTLHISKVFFPTGISLDSWYHWSAEVLQLIVFYNIPHFAVGHDGVSVPLDGYKWSLVDLCQESQWSDYDAQFENKTFVYFFENWTPITLINVVLLEIMKVTRALAPCTTSDQSMLGLAQRAVQKPAGETTRNVRSHNAHENCHHQASDTYRYIAANKCTSHLQMPMNAKFHLYKHRNFWLS